MEELRGSSRESQVRDELRGLLEAVVVAEKSFRNAKTSLQEARRGLLVAYQQYREELESLYLNKRITVDTQDQACAEQIVKRNGEWVAEAVCLTANDLEVRGVWVPTFNAAIHDADDYIQQPDWLVAVDHGGETDCTYNVPLIDTVSITVHEDSVT